MKIGLSGAVFLVFLVLKLTHAITWSWWWVTSPLWIGALFGLGFVLLFALGRMAGDWQRRRRWLARQEKKGAAALLVVLLVAQPLSATSYPSGDPTIRPARRLDLLPMPSPALPTDQRPVCLPEWR